MIKYNCSENTKFPNLKFTCQGDKDKFAGIKYIKGPLLNALTTKNTAFLMDEANLSPIEVLQALEAVIDNGYLVYEDKGKLIRVDVPKDFCCILTLNPSKGKFSGTRQELPESFKNKFISIEFPEMKREELYAITDGASKAFGVDKKVENCKQFIDDFISFHMEWSKNEKIQDDVACLVIRDILAVLHIILEGEDPTETIMNIYGARYIEEIKKEMKEVLFKFISFKNYNVNHEKIIKNFPKDCFMNKNTLELISTCIFSLRHGRHPIIAGNNGTGKKMLACKLADYFNEHIAEKNIDNNEDYDKASSNNINTSTNISVKTKINKNDDTTEYIVYCTKSSKVEDLMGKPKVSNNKNEDLIQWQDGPLIKAVREGKPLILLGIHELQSSVLEYMNDLLDRKYDGKQRFLNNPNNPNEPYIPIHKNFRLICTTLLSDINKLSPAFATRMDIKILNDQLEGISQDELLSLIKICMNNAKEEIISYREEIKKRIKDLNDEMQMNLTRLETSKLSFSSKNLVTVEGNKNTEKSRKDSIDSKKSNKSNDSKKSNKSIDSKNSSKSYDSKKSDKSKDSNVSKKSDQSKHSRKSSNSKDSKNSEKSKHSRKSSNSKDSKNSEESKHSRRSKKSRKNSDASDEENSENTSEKKKKSRRSSMDSKSENKEQESEDENLSEEQDTDSNETEIKLLEGILSKFDEKRINEIVNNGDLLLELKQNYDNYNSDNEIKMNMTLLDKYIRSTILLLDKLKYETFTDIKTIAKLVYDLLFSDQISIVIDEKIKNYILNEILINDPINKYFYKGIMKIENYMLSLYLYCAMNIPIYVFGPPGVGKTAGAECLARIRTYIEQLEGNYKKYAFNSATNPSDIFGAETLVDGQVKLIDGPLTESALNGQTFIADEMNLSSNNTMMSLIPVFNTLRSRLIYFPGLQTPIKINPYFWFGAFQNYEGTAGRNATPHELSLKLVRLDYPTVETEDIKNICIRIRNSIYENMEMNISDDEILQLATFMIKLNKRRDDGNLASAEAWSIRNLENIINRMAEQQKCRNPTYKRIQYENCALYVNVLFYVLSYIDFESVDESFDEILNLITECFQLNQKESEELRKTYFSKPEISYDDSDKFFSLKKNSVVIKFRNSKIGNNINFLNKISSLLNTLFVCLLCADTEPILLIGPSGYKTYLVQLLINNIKIITLNEESSIDALLGSTGFFNLEEVKAFYLSLICDVCIKNQKLLYLQQLKEGKLNIKDLKTRIKNFFSEDNSNCGRRIVFKDMVNRILDKLLKVMNNKNANSDNILNNIKLEFKPGLFTSAILSGDSLNLRNFDKIPTTTLERFNELFTGMKTLTLNEDKFNTITTAKNKLICETVDFIRFFATSSTKNFSEAVLSRWTVINTKEYEFEELEEVLKICSGEKNLDTVTQNDIKYLIEVARFFKNTSNKTVSIKLLINTIELFHDMNKNLGEFKEEDKEEKEKLYYINRQFIYYVTLRSIIEQNKDEENSSENEINDKLYEYLFTSNKERQIQIEIPKGKSPFSFGNKNNLNGMKSIITNAFIPCIKNDYPKLKPAFTPKFVEMLNIIHLGLSLNCTTVIEGQIGQGKQTAIKFLSEILGFKLLVIQLSSSNKEEDLLGKVIVDKDKKTNNTVIKVNETDLLKVLKNQKKIKFYMQYF
jgi:MoxR-like ATPase